MRLEEGREAKRRGEEKNIREEREGKGRLEKGSQIH
jgi:hypothetical protein